MKARSAWVLLLGVSLAVMVAGGCSTKPADEPVGVAWKSNLPKKARRILDRADGIELCSLEPSPDPDREGERIRAWTVLGKTAIAARESGNCSRSSTRASPSRTRPGRRVSSRGTPSGPVMAARRSSW